MSILDHLGTDQLRRTHAALSTNVPGDPTFAAAVGNFLRSIIGRELSDPKRVEEDKKLTADLAKQAEDALAAKRKAELDAAPHDDAAKEIADRHAAEQAAADKAAKVAAFDAKQAADRQAFIAA